MKKLLLSAFFLSTMSVLAQDRVFNYTYQSSVLGKGQKEIEVWNTLLSGKDDFYREIKQRVEYEVGLGSNLQVALYLNTKQKAYFSNGTIEKVAPKISFSNEWKYKFSDAVANKIGFAGYAEFTIDPYEFEIELKAIFDKIIGRTYQAINFVYEPEWKMSTEDNAVVTEKEVKYEINYGFAYNINHKWNLGAEIVNSNAYSPETKFTHSALFAGPTISFNSKNFWINASVLPQIGVGLTDGMDGLNTDEYTKINSRIIFSYSF